MRYIFSLLVLVSFSFAQPLSLGKPNEEKIHSSWLNVGLGIGVLSPIDKSYKDQRKAFVNPAVLIGIQFAELSALTFEFDFTTPEGGVGGWVGFEQQFMKAQITPFAEVQLGARNPGKKNEFGPAGSLNGGLIFFRESQVRIRLKGGYEMIFNEDINQSWNAEAGVLFAFGKAGLEAIKVN